MTGLIDIYKAAVDKWGQDVQLDMLIEEMLEAIITIIDFKDPSSLADIQDNINDYKDKMESGGLIDGLQGMVDAAGITIAKFIKIQATTLKIIMKYLRKDKRNMHDEPLEIAKIIMAAAMTEPDDAGEDVQERLADELADVEIMIDQARHGMGLNDLIDKHKASKLIRLKKRLEK